MILDTSKLTAPIVAVWHWFKAWLATPTLEKLQQLGCIVLLAIIYRLIFR